ncbi:MAG: ABC transporter substrate-binding protein [Pseudoruegeria sp.]
MRITHFFKTKGAGLAAGTLAALLATTSLAQDYSEAPMLAEQVAAGILPSVDERLPLEPRVVTPYNEIGTYGGTWRRAFRGPSDDRGPQKLMEPRIVRFVQAEPGVFDIEPGWASSYEINETSTEFTFHIREGLKWSDGHPVTTEDVLFYFEDVIGDDNPWPWPSLLQQGDERAVVAAVDDLTFTVTFAQPSPLFVTRLGREYVWMAKPAHYLRQFHPAYASADELKAAAAEFEVEGWEDLWGRRGKAESYWMNPEVPTLSAWTITTPPPAEQVVFERNPYYYAVDTEGNQLPYIDQITHDLFQDTETLNLWVAQGRIDLQQRHMGVGNFPFFKENEGAGDYEVVIWSGLEVDTLWPNQTTNDPVMAKMFQTADFREAMNVALDRETINEIVFAGLTTPMQAAPPEGSAIFNEDFVAKWAEYDPDRANALLDGMGLTERDSDGFRLRPDGETLEIIITTALFASDINMLELVSEFWSEVGIKTSLDVVERTLYLDRVNANEVMMGHWPMGRAALILIDPAAYAGTLADNSWATAWGEFYLNRANPKDFAVAPPEDHLLNDVWALLDQASTAATQEDAMALGAEVLALHAEAPNWVGVVGAAPNLFIRSNRMGNFPEGFIRDDITRDIGIIPTEQLYIKE